MFHLTATHALHHSQRGIDLSETYCLHIESVLDSDKTEFMMDVIEFCPKEIYDNPEVPEDIW